MGWDSLRQFLACPSNLRQAEIDLAMVKGELTSARMELEECKAAFENADLSAIIRQLGPKVAASMDPAGYGKPWWDCLQALADLFRAKTEYVEWGPFQVWGQIQAAYPSIRLLAGFRDQSYRVLTKRDMVVAITDSTYVRWMGYELNWRDCTAFAERFRSHLNVAYEVNACAVVNGDHEGGSHSWNLVPTVEGLVMVDTLSMARTAPVPPGLPGYLPREVAIL
jgi:hypothetical protein